jgi:PAS domain S-box-containing protein
MRNRSSVDEGGLGLQDAIGAPRHAARWRYRGEAVSGRGVGSIDSCAPAAVGRPSILLVEDDRRLCDSLASLLRVVDYEVLSVYSGAEAVAAVETREFDAAVIDMDLPDVDGVEVLRAIRGADPELGVLLMAGAASLERAAESLDLGADAFIAIPANPDLLLSRLGRVARLKGLERRLGESEARYRELVEGIDEGVFRTDAEGRYLMINQAGAELLGYDRPRNVLECGLGVWGTLFSLEERETLRARVLREGRVRTALGRFRRSDGNLGWLETTIKAVQDAGGAIVGFEGFFREVSDRIGYLETLEALQGFWADLGEVDGLEEICGLAVEFLNGVIGFETASFTVVNVLLLNKLARQIWNNDPQNKVVKDRRAIVRAVRTGEIQIIPDTCEEMGYTQNPLADVDGATSVLAVPVKLGGEVVAVIEVSCARPGGFLDEERKLVEIVADHVASAIDRLVLTNFGPKPGVKLKDFI